METSFDVIVIGGGSAGLAFSKEAARRGAAVLLIERDKLGGTCVNRGCVPKKMMWSVSDALQTQAAMVSQGFLSEGSRLDFAKLAAVRAEKIADIVDSFDDQLDEAGVQHLVGDAILQAYDTVLVGDTAYTTDRIVLATGTRPSPLDIEGGELMDLSDDVFEWNTVPQSLVVIGGGYIGSEMAAIFNGFGSQITIVSNSPAVLTEFSEAAQNLAAQNLTASGVSLVLDVKPTEVAVKDGKFQVKLTDGTELEAERVLNATGRDPNLDVFGDLEHPEQADTGALAVDEGFKTSIDGIYAIGDIADRLPLTPVAREDGEVLAKQLFGAPETKPIDLDKVSTTAFVFPPIGEVGKTSGLTEITTFTAMEALIADKDASEGWALERDGNGGLAGVAVVGHAAAEAVSWAGLSVHAGLTRADMNETVAVHPSRAEQPLGSQR